MILNLKELNTWINYNHFKMDSIHTCIQLMKPHYFMGSVDLQNAYYSIPVHPAHQKYLKFAWQGKLYQFTCLAQGLASAPRLFTKIMKPVFATLRGKGHLSSSYLDDSFLVGSSYDECKANIRDTLDLLRALGFYPNEDKSVIKPTHKIQHLGFILDSIELSVSISSEKLVKLIDIATLVLDSHRIRIRLVAKLIGHMVSCFPAVEYAELFYRQLEIDKSTALKEAKGNFDALMTCSDRAISDIKWWIADAQSSKKSISHGPIALTMHTDASLLGWGATIGEKTTGGEWSTMEKENHINLLELKAVLLGLQSLCNTLSNCHIKVLTDNTTAVAYLRNMGGSHSIPCNDMAREIWMWCRKHKIWISISHIPGVDNTIADKASRVFNDQTEWKLDETIFTHITNICGCPDIDMFASRLNYQLLPYVAWRPDPQAIAIDAFTVDWSKYSLIYAFPPFSVISRVLQKIQMEQTEAIIVVPQWPTQPWYPHLIQMLVESPLILPKRDNLLHLPSKPDICHPLAGQLKLMACHLSGQPSKIREFHQLLRNLSSAHGEEVHKNNTGHTGTNGNVMLVKNLLIPFNLQLTKS